MLDRDRLASNVCKILDFHMINVAGMWILHLVYVIIDSFRMNVFYQELFTPLQNEITVSTQRVFSARVTPQAL